MSQTGVRIHCGMLAGPPRRGIAVGTGFRLRYDVADFWRNTRHPAEFIHWYEYDILDQSMSVTARERGEWLERMLCRMTPIHHPKQTDAPRDFGIDRGDAADRGTGRSGTV